MSYQNILLIDDDSDDQEIFTEAIGSVSDKVNCITLSSANEALTKLKSSQLLPDVIFLDLNMPVMGGQEFLVAIKNIDHLKAIPVIIFSTSANPATIVSTKKLGAIDFIVKPGRFDELVTILKSYLEN